MEKNIKLSSLALSAIVNLQHPNGTFRYYSNTLSRMINLVLNFSDEIGMSDREAMATLRALHGLREDLGCISGFQDPLELEAEDDPTDVAAKVSATFDVFDVSDEWSDSNYPEPAEEGKEYPDPEEGSDPESGK